MACFRGKTPYNSLSAARVIAAPRVVALNSDFASKPLYSKLPPLHWAYGFPLSCRNPALFFLLSPFSKVAFFCSSAHHGFLNPRSVVNVHQNGMPKDNSNQRQPYDTQRVLLPLMAFLTATAQRAYTIFFICTATGNASRKPWRARKTGWKRIWRGVLLNISQFKIKKGFN
jgi:hypothetical protein